jgi:hypothetical protein
LYRDNRAAMKSDANASAQQEPFGFQNEVCDAGKTKHEKRCEIF